MTTPKGGQQFAFCHHGIVKVMLEAIREHAQGWIAKLILALIIIPFALWGVDSYFKGDGKEQAVAKVGKEEIGQREFFQALQSQRDALQQRLHTKIDIDNKDFRKGVLDQLVNTVLMSQAAQKNGLIVPSSQIEQMIQSAPIFQSNGAFSPDLFQAWLRKQGLTQKGLIHLLQQDSFVQQFQMGYGQGSVVSTAGVTQLAGLLAQQREVNEAVFSTKDYAKGVTVDDKAIEAEYNAHKADYAVPAQVRVQYLVLSADGIRSSIQISDQAARQYYDANKVKYQQPEQRHASHILIKADSTMSAADQAAAKAKAEKIYEELRANPGKFAELAKQDSQDPGSAANGGDLGSFTRETMVKPFADAVFSMKVGELSAPVKTEYGYHIIRLDGITPGKQVPFESVKPEIVAQLAQQEAERKFADEADKFSNVVYEQSDSLDPAAKQFGLKVLESGWMSRDHADPALLAKPELMDAIFSQDSIDKRQNTEAIEVATDTLVSARVVDFKPAGTRPLADVAAEIRARLVAQAAKAKAVEAGEQALKQAEAGHAVAGLGATMTVSRMQPLNLAPASIKAIFKADAGKLPAMVGVSTDDGYHLFRLTRVLSPAPADVQVKGIQRDLAGVTMKQEMDAYLAFAKAKAGVKINESVLEKKAD